MKNEIRKKIDEIMKPIIKKGFHQDIMMKGVTVLLLHDIADSLRTIAENINCKTEVEK